MESYIEEKYQKWLHADLPNNLREQLEQMNEEQIRDSFYCDLEFGTAGIRGILGPGSNRLNIYVIRKVTYAFALYLLKTYPNVKEHGIVISHDNRLFSREFTLEASKMLSSFGIKTYIFDSLRPTPTLSYAVRKLSCCGGIMITASHNPKEYNGYKVYDEEGCQLVPSKIKPYIDIIKTLGSEIDIPFGDAETKGEIITLGEDIDESYIEEVKGILLNRDLDKSNFKIVFTPQHGTSLEIARKIFTSLGYHVIYVEEQCTHDPLFSGTKSPNPELKEAYELPLVYAKKYDADIIMMTDPDADRCGIAIKNKTGEYELFTGNQTGALLIDYVFSQRKAKGLLHENGVLFDSIVTSSFGEEIAQSYGIEVESVLTGFKYIGEKIKEHEEHHDKVFEFGYEESYGYVLADFVRDKDSLQALTMIAEMVNYYLLQGKTLDVVYDELQQRFSYHQDVLHSIYFEGQDGKEKMNNIMNQIRIHPLTKVNHKKVVKIEDYLTLTCHDVIKNHDAKINLSSTDNMVKYYLEDGSTIAIRPSGTEPKCKFYYGAKGKSKKEVSNKPEAMHQDLLKILGL
jgi:phosphoglucomutase